MENKSSSSTKTRRIGPRALNQGVPGVNYRFFLSQFGLGLIYLFSETFLEVLDAIFELASYNILFRKSCLLHFMSRFFSDRSTLDEDTGSRRLANLPSISRG